MIQGFKRNVNSPVERYDYQSLDNKPQFDDTLSVTGRIADAKAVGDNLTQIRSDIQTLTNSIPNEVKKFIKDTDAPNDQKLWSSQKTNLEIHGLIDNESNSTSNNTTWGSTKIKQVIDSKIDDNHTYDSQDDTQQPTTWSSEKIDNQIDSRIETYFTNKLNSIYPVGSIYISVNNVNPGIVSNPSSGFLPGTWQHWGAGRAIFGATNQSGDIMCNPEVTGGGHYVTLTMNNIPQHAHTYKTPSNSLIKGHVPAKTGTGPSVLADVQLSYASGTSATSTSGNAGKASPDPIDIWPYYITAYFWKRIS